MSREEMARQDELREAVAAAEPFIRADQTARIVEWLHTPDALWVVEKARRDGVPEYAADRLADEVERRFGGGESGA